MGALSLLSEERIRASVVAEPESTCAAPVVDAPPSGATVAAASVPAVDTDAEVVAAADADRTITAAIERASRVTIRRLYAIYRPRGTAKSRPYINSLNYAYTRIYAEPYR